MVVVGASAMVADGRPAMLQRELRQEKKCRADDLVGLRYRVRHVNHVAFKGRNGRPWEACVTTPGQAPCNEALTVV